MSATFRRCSGLGAALSLALVGCSLAPFDPVVGGDASMDAGARTDGGAVDAAGLDARSPFDAPPGFENCGNGVDDDGDGDADCADSDCVDVACVPAPAGWSAPGVLARGTGTPSCDIGSPTPAGGRGLSAEDVTCGACACGDPTGVGCRASLRGWANNLCTLVGRLDSANFPGACVALTRGHRAINSVTLSVTATCEVSGPATPPIEVRPDAEYAESSVLCVTPGAAGCGAGMTCSPIGDGSGHCVSMAGDVDCPAGYPVRRRSHANVDDGRACSSCSCGAAGTSCSGTISSWTSTNCTTGALASISAPSTACTDLGAIASSIRLTSATPVGARCDSAGGRANGCVAPADPVTVCCQPGVAPGCPSGPGPAMALIEPSGDTASFCIDTTEVTNAQYMAFLTAGGPGSAHPGCVTNDTIPNDLWPPDPSELDFPVVRVDWCDAHAYCAWAGKRLCRLLDGTSGDGDTDTERDPDLSEWTHVCDRTPRSDCRDGVRSVASRMCCQTDGIYDLPGGAREWVDNCDSRRDDGECLTHRRSNCIDVNRRNRDSDNRDLGFRCCADSI